jgi:septal ring factor EnvC (AmiA/AmiB activator)
VIDSLIRRAAQTNLETLDDLSARHRTLNYEYERLGKALASSKVAQGRMETEVNGWKVRVAEVEKRLIAEETKTKELREDVNRGRKAVEAVRIAAGVSGHDLN